MVVVGVLGVVCIVLFVRLQVGGETGLVLLLLLLVGIFGVRRVFAFVGAWLVDSDRDRLTTMFAGCCCLWGW